MNRFLLKICILLLLTVVASYSIFFYGNSLAAMEFGPNTQKQINISFTNASKSEATCWFLGNSRIYRGIDPEAIHDTKSYNFAHDNDSYNQIFYKLKFLEEQGRKVDTLILGTDYFQFSIFADTRNYVYDGYLGMKYSKDYSSFFPTELFNNLKRQLINNQVAFHSSVLSYCMRGFKHPTFLPSISDYGQYRYYSEAKKDDSVKRDATIIEIQKKYFIKIIEFCQVKGINIFVLMPPIRDNELSNYTEEEMNKVRMMINNTLTAYGYKGHYFDFSNHPCFKDYKKYTDITHLKPEAAKEFTALFWNYLKRTYL